jgi:N-acetylneuraminic acid mutarotase
MDAVAYALATQIQATYNVPTGWAAKASLPATRYWHCQSTLDDNTVLVTGGHVGGSTISADVQLYDPSTDTWTSKTNLPVAITSHQQVTSDDGKVIVFGGRTTSSVSSGVNNVREYDPSTNAWTSLTSMQYSTWGHAMALLQDGTILTTGGYNSNIVRLYDPSTDTWTSKATLSSARYYHNLFTLSDGTLLMCGGYRGGWTVTTEIYDAGTWSYTANSPVAFNYANSVYMGGGITRVFGAANRISYDYDDSDDTWSAVSLVVPAKYSRSGVSIQPGGKILMTGGYDNSEPIEESALVYMFDPGGDIPVSGRAALLGYLAAT